MYGGFVPHPLQGALNKNSLHDHQAYGEKMTIKRQKQVCFSEFFTLHK